jgi:peptide chain release factor 1
LIERLIEQIEHRYRELTEQLADPETIADRPRYTGLARSHRELQEAHRLAEEYRRAESDAAGAEELLRGGDGELDETDRTELQQLVATARGRMEELEQDLRLAMV